MEKQDLPSREELAKLPRRAIVAYAVRNALRVLPLLKSESVVDFEMALMVTVLYAFDERLSYSEKLASAYIAGNISRTNKVYAAAVAATSAAYTAANDNYNTYELAGGAFKASEAAQACATSTFVPDDAVYRLIGFEEFKLLNSLSYPNSVKSIFNKKLWFDIKALNEQPLKEWQNFLHKIEKEDVYSRYMLFYEGNFDDKNLDLLENEVRAWLKSKSPTIRHKATTQTSVENDLQIKNEYATSKGAGMSDVDLLGRDKLTNALVSLPINS